MKDIKWLKCVRISDINSKNPWNQFTENKVYKSWIDKYNSICLIDDNGTKRICHFKSSTIAQFDEVKFPIYGWKVLKYLFL